MCTRMLHPIVVHVLQKCICSDPAPATSKSRQQTENDNMSEIRQLIPVIKFDIASVQSPLIVSQIRLSATMLGSSENDIV